MGRVVGRVVASLTLVTGAAGVGPSTDLGAQQRWVGGHAQLVASVGSEGMLGYSISGEFAVVGPVRAAVSRVAWDGVRGCAVDDALTNCPGAPVLWELGARLGLGVSERVAPFLGAGLGLYRRTWSTTLDPSSISWLTTPNRSSSASLAVSAGLDIKIASPLVVRFMAVHQEVLDDEVQEYYRFFAGRRLTFTGLSAGLGIAVW